MPKSKYYRRPDGLYEAIRVIDGKRVAFRAKKVQDLERKMREYNGSQEKKRLFEAVADEWWTEHEPTLAWNTAKSYKPAVERAKEAFGKENVAKITAQDVDGFIRDFSRGGRSQKVVNTQLQIVRQILGYAALRGVISVNPAQVVKAPHGLPRNYRQPPSQEEVKAIKESEDKHLLPALIYYTGARWGEALALRWDDLDWEAGTISIRRSVYYVSTSPEVKDPKTEKGKRKVPLLDGLRRLLEGRKGKGYIFSPDGGKSLLWESPAHGLYKKFQLETGLTLTAHQIRHGYATALLEAGVEPRVAQALLGHAQLSTTMDIYTHVRDSMIADAASKMNAAF